MKEAVSKYELALVGEKDQELAHARDRSSEYGLAAMHVSSNYRFVCREILETKGSAVMLYS